MCRREIHQHQDKHGQTTGKVKAARDVLMIRKPTRHEECLKGDVDEEVVKMFHLDDVNVTPRLIQSRHERDKYGENQQKHGQFQRSQWHNDSLGDVDERDRFVGGGCLTADGIRSHGDALFLIQI